MPSLFAILPVLVLAPDSAPPQAPLIHQVACSQVVDGKCVVQVAASGGAGGSGGNTGGAHYTIIINGQQQAGSGGSGGNASGSGSGSGPPSSGIKNVNATAPTAMKPIKAVISRCTLEIAGKSVVDNAGCGFEKNEKKMSFFGADAKGLRYITTVIPNQDMTTGQGYLAGGRSASSRSLGTMTKEGPCWRSMDQSVRVCGWR